MRMRSALVGSFVTPLELLPQWAAGLRFGLFASGSQEPRSGAPKDFADEGYLGPL